MPAAAGRLLGNGAPTADGSSAGCSAMRPSHAGRTPVSSTRPYETTIRHRVKTDMRTSYLAEAWADVEASFGAFHLWTLLGWLEIRQRYSRSLIGPFWLTLSMAVMVGALGVVYGALFSMKLDDYLPMLTIGLVVWTFLTGVLNEGCMAFIAASAYLRQAVVARLVFVLQVGWRHVLVLLHNFVIVVAVLAIYGVRDWSTLPLFLPAFGLLVLNVLWMATVLAILSARFRDLPQIVSSLLQVAFYVTPILFHREMLKAHEWIVTFNPFAHLIEIVRNPLMGIPSDPLNWIVVTGMALAGWPLALALLGRYHKRIPYWV